jgi:polysaccharide biosynthesis protein PelA
MMSDRTVPPRKAIQSVRNFAVQFSGEYRLGDFSQFDLVIMDPDQSRNSEADSLSVRKVLPIAYLNIGEAEEYRWYFSEIKHEWLLGKNPNWERHFYIDVNNADWQKLVLDKILPRIYRSEYAGVFLDMIDIASPELYPASREGVIKLINRIRAAYPDKIILMNNGVFLAESVSDEIDGICVESVFSTYDFAAKNYFLRTKAEYEARARELQDLQTRLKTRIFVIDYAVPGDTATQSFVRTNANAYGLTPFVSNIELNVIYPTRR